MHRMYLSFMWVKGGELGKTHLLLQQLFCRSCNYVKQGPFLAHAGQSAVHSFCGMLTKKKFDWIFKYSVGLNRHTSTTVAAFLTAPWATARRRKVAVAA